MHTHRLCLDNQRDESEMFRNREHTPAFDEFLEFIGEKIELLGWEGYHGGLDTTSIVEMNFYSFILFFF